MTLGGTQEESQVNSTNSTCRETELRRALKAGLRCLNDDGANTGRPP